MINDLFQVARHQKTHEKYLMRHNNLGNTYDNDISLHEQSQIADNFQNPISDQNEIYYRNKISNQMIILMRILT